MATIVISNETKRKMLEKGFGEGSTVYVAVKTSNPDTFTAEEVVFGVKENNYIKTTVPITFLVNSGVTVDEIRIAATAQGADSDGPDVMGRIILTGADRAIFSEVGAYVIASITIAAN